MCEFISNKMSKFKKSFERMCLIDTGNFPGIPTLIKFNPTGWLAEVQLNKTNRAKIIILFEEIKDIEKQIKSTWKRIRGQLGGTRHFYMTSLFVEEAARYIKEETGFDVE
jgi:hypothetical protein